MGLPLAKAELIGTLLEAICYGMYFMVSLELFRLLYVRVRAGRQTMFLFATAMVIFGLITTHLVLQLNRMIEAFADHMDVANASVTYFNTLPLRDRLTKTAIYMTLTLVCGALFVYRVFVVYERKYVSIIFPSMLLFSDIALSAWSIWTVTQINSSIGTVEKVNERINYFYAMTLALNVLCTAMITWKIWAVHRKASQRVVADVRFMGVMTAIVESAAVYSCVLIILMVTSALGTAGLWIILDAVCPIIGMVFSAVIVRASKEHHTGTFMTTSFSLPTSFPTDHATGSARVPGQTVQVPYAANKQGPLMFHVSASAHQASYVDSVDQGYQTSEAGV